VFDIAIGVDVVIAVVVIVFFFFGVAAGDCYVWVVDMIVVVYVVTRYVGIVVHAADVDVVVV